MAIPYVKMMFMLPELLFHSLSPVNPAIVFLQYACAIKGKKSIDPVFMLSGNLKPIFR